VATFLALKSTGMVAPSLSRMDRGMLGMG
jgi:hypothetical protein